MVNILCSDMLRDFHLSGESAVEPSATGVSTTQGAAKDAYS
ncbi:hypothetical protein Pcac1_g9388 [Phytophthora cactorum]|nr:hypothetical protein Pcac1_g9388 [Phytophthora cactorum]RAW27052.1 hypothetical protein PC110_g16556 [Phytophthora cactorum]